MELKSISGVTCYVEDLDRSEKFYESLGFRVGKRDAASLTVYVNWFWIKLCVIDKETHPEFQKEAHLDPKGAGVFLSIKIDDADASYKEVVSLGITPSSEPRDWPWGNREFVVRDPDGYKLVFFQKK